MTRDSRLSGLHRKSVAERLDALVAGGFLDEAAARQLAAGRPLLPVAGADRMVENVIGSFGLPFAVATNFLVDGRESLVPMVVEEPSIVAGLSGAAKLARKSGGFRTSQMSSLLAGQVHLVDFPDQASAEAAIAAIEAARDELIDKANATLPRLVARGGGVRDVEARHLKLDDSIAVCVHLYVDTCDAMGANLVNGLCEAMAPEIEALAGGRALLRILSNLADRSLVSATVRMPLALLRAKGLDASDVRDGIVLATALADADPWRAATHNKGVMNGVDAVAIATGNDWRAIEAGAHAHVSAAGRYRSLTRWSVNDEGDLEGTIEMPLKVGIVGGSLEANPGARLGLELAGVDSARELAALMAAVGLAQNFAALRALVTHGIQHGHMRLHARSVAATAGVPDHLFDTVVSRLIKGGDIKVHRARALLTELTEAHVEERDAGSVASGTGTAAGKLILLGEHAAVYDRHVLAVPLPDALAVSLGTADAAHSVVLVERGRKQVLDPTSDAAAGMFAVIDRVRAALEVDDDCFAVEVTTRIPPGMGLGASAAFAVALIRAFADRYALSIGDDEVNALAYDCETLAHGTPSGIDNTLATYARPVLYRRSATPPTRDVPVSETLPLVVASSGRVGKTLEQVDGVRRRRARQVETYDAIFARMDSLALDGADALAKCDYERLGDAMNVCHGLLNAIGVSTPELEQMVAVARTAGALGAKLTGAGGGGSIVALCPDGTMAVASALAEAGFDIVGPAGN